MWKGKEWRQTALVNSLVSIDNNIQNTGIFKMEAQNDGQNQKGEEKTAPTLEVWQSPSQSKASS